MNFKTSDEILAIAINNALTNDMIKLIMRVSELTDEDHKFQLLLGLVPSMTALANNMTTKNEPEFMTFTRIRTDLDQMYEFRDIVATILK